MSKTITSPVEEFPGTVKLPNRLTMPQALAFEQSISEGSALRDLEEVTQTQYDKIMVDVICEIIEEWNLDDLEQLTPDIFPATPRVASAELVAWIYSEILQLYNPDIPNE